MAGGRAVVASTSVGHWVYIKVLRIVLPDSHLEPSIARYVGVVFIEQNSVSVTAHSSW